MKNSVRGCRIVRSSGAEAHWFRRVAEAAPASGAAVSRAIVGARRDALAVSTSRRILMQMNQTRFILIT